MATILPAAAASYDGTYDYSYQYEWDGQWSTKDLGEVFVVSGGDNSISGSSGAFWGSVDSFGGVTFYGPSP